jgi:hypothetical protein
MSATIIYQPKPPCQCNLPDPSLFPFRTVCRCDDCGKHWEIDHDGLWTPSLVVTR